MNQLALENILRPAQGATSHCAGLVTVSKTSFDELAASPEQTLAIVAANPLPILINGLLFFFLALPVPLVRLLLFRNVGANFVLLDLFEHRAAMIAFVRNQLFDPVHVDLRLRFRMQIGLALD